jgi:hypothetical protein
MEVKRSNEVFSSLCRMWMVRWVPGVLMHAQLAKAFRERNELAEHLRDAIMMELAERQPDWDGDGGW